MEAFNGCWGCQMESDPGAAAFHEAGHIIVAFLSKYHSLTGQISVDAYGHGAASVTLSKSKLEAGGKSPDLSSRTDKEVVRDLGPILVAGLEAEKIAAEQGKISSANEVAARLDYELLAQELVAAGLSKKTDVAEQHARSILREEWQLVESLASHIHRSAVLDAMDAVELIGQLRSNGI